MEYTGPEIRILRESMRMTKLMNGNVSVQSLFQANLSLTENKAETSNEMAGMVNWNYALHYQFRLTENLPFRYLFPLYSLSGTDGPGTDFEQIRYHSSVWSYAYFHAGYGSRVRYIPSVKDRCPIYW